MDWEKLLIQSRLWCAFEGLGGVQRAPGDRWRPPDQIAGARVAAFGDTSDHITRSFPHGQRTLSRNSLTPSGVAFGL